MSVSNSFDSRDRWVFWDVVVEPIAEADFAEPSSSSGGFESEVEAVARRLAAVSLSRVPSSSSFESADSGPAICQHVDFRFYAVWYAPGPDISGIYWGGRPRGWNSWHPTWTFLENQLPGGRYLRSGARLKRYLSLDKAILGYQREALRHGVPLDPLVVRTPCPLCGR